MKHASFFSGQGGFDLAAEWMGWENVLHCEINPFCQTILKYYWPNAISYADIKTTDFSIHRGQIDILTGGFPCQPYSYAGSRKGKEDSRHLWPEMLRGVREIQPRYIVGENVRGIVNWSNGLVFDEVQSELENEGYEVVPFILPACGIGADHIRERVWFIAHSCGMGREDVQSNPTGSSNPTGNAKWTRSQSSQWNKEANELDSLRNTFLRFQEMHSQPAIFDVDDGLPFELDGITVPKWIEQSHTSAGNSIHPEIAYQIFKAIESVSNLNPHQ